MELKDKDERRLAFAVIDMQKKFMTSKVSRSVLESHIEVINAASESFRAAGRPVIFVRYTGEMCEGHEYECEDGDDFFDGLIIEESDIIINKNHMNGFRETKLAEVIKKRGCDNILLAGTVTHFCVMSTYFGAFDNGLVPFLLSGGCMSSSGEINKAAELLCKTYNMDEIRANLMNAVI